MWGQEPPIDPIRSGAHCCGSQSGPQLWTDVSFFDAQLQKGLFPAAYWWGRVSAWPGMQTDQSTRRAAAPVRQRLGNVGMT